MEDMPLVLQLENVKKKFNATLSEVIMEYGVPAFLVSGILAELMLEVKRQEKLELVNSYHQIISKLEDDKKELEQKL